MNGIAIYIVTKETHDGNLCGFKLMMREGCKVTIAWGDGKTDTYQGSNGWTQLEHEYPEYGIPYFISVFSEEDNSILGLHGAEMEHVKTVELNISPCPSLKYLYYEPHVSVMIDTSRNPLLYDLNIGANKVLPLCNSVAMQSVLDKEVKLKEQKAYSGAVSLRHEFHRCLSNVFAFARSSHIASSMKN